MTLEQTVRHMSASHQATRHEQPQPYQRDDWTSFDSIAVDPHGEDGEPPWSFEVRRAINPEYVIYLPEDDEGRSNWFWLRTPNNDLMLACFPRGDLGYSGSEPDWGRT